MKINKNLFAVGITALVLTAACKKQDNPGGESSAENLVRFSSSIKGQLQIKAVGDKWEANDAIGVFMKTGNGLNNAIAANKKYVTTGNGNFSPATTDQGVFFPADGSKVDFVAYYPFAQTLNANKISVNVATQTNQSNIDLLYSANAKDLSKSTQNAQLIFDHQLTKIELNIKNGEGVANLTGLTTTLNGLPTTSEFDLATGVLATGTNVAAITALKTENASAVKAEAILIPTDATSGANVVFAVGSSSFKWTLPAGLKFEKGKKYNYDIELRNTPNGGPVAVSVAATITDWTNVPGGSHVVDQDKGSTDPGTPDPGTGGGTEQTLFLEDFGTDVLPTSPRPKIGTYTGYLNKAVTYSDSFSSADLRTITGSTNHVWMPANKDAEVNIAGINLAGVSKLKLSFDVAFNLSGATGNHSWVKIKLNGETITVPAKVIPSANNNSFETVNIDLSAFPVSKLIAASTLVFSTDATNTTGLRLDNIKLVGTK